ncbi:MAG: adenosine-specific kinase [Candidatus Bathyarchaeia archaeon]
MDIMSVKIESPKDANMILGMSHFIKTVEDLYEALITSASGIRFGIGFCESSGPCLVRHAGNDKELEDAAAREAFKLAAGHSFIIFIRNAFPINVLSRVKSVQEVCTVYCATANPVEVLIAESEQGRGIIGVIDGFKSKGIEGEPEIEERKAFLRKIGYKI